MSTFDQILEILFPLKNILFNSLNFELYQENSMKMQDRALALTLITFAEIFPVHCIQRYKQRRKFITRFGLNILSGYFVTEKY